MLGTDVQHVGLDDVALGEEDIQRGAVSAAAVLPGVDHQFSGQPRDHVLVTHRRCRRHDELAADELAAQVVVGERREVVVGEAGLHGRRHGIPPAVIGSAVIGRRYGRTAG